MEILILNALGKKSKDYEQFRKVLETNLQAKKYSYEWVNVREMSVNTCIGTKCLACQFKTPGLCKQKDDMQSLYPKLIQAELLVFLTPISLGSYHSELKKIIDRFIPLDIPVYTIYQGELHHKSRYENMPNLLSIGLLEDEKQESMKIFTKLTERNAINMLIEKYASVVIKNDADLAEVENEIVDKLKELV